MTSNPSMRLLHTNDIGVPCVCGKTVYGDEWKCSCGRHYRVTVTVYMFDEPDSYAKKPRIVCPECYGSGSITIEQARELRGNQPTYMADQEHLDRMIFRATGETIYPAGHWDSLEATNE